MTTRRGGRRGLAVLRTQVRPPAVGPPVCPARPVARVARSPRPGRRLRGLGRSGSRRCVDARSVTVRGLTSVVRPVAGRGPCRRSRTAAATAGPRRPRRRRGTGSSRPSPGQGVRRSSRRGRMRSRSRSPSAPRSRSGRRHVRRLVDAGGCRRSVPPKACGPPASMRRVPAEPGPGRLAELRAAGARVAAPFRAELARRVRRVQVSTVDAVTLRPRPAGSRSCGGVRTTPGPRHGSSGRC